MLATIQNLIFELEKYRIGVAELQLPIWAFHHFMQEYSNAPGSIVLLENGSVSIWGGIKLTKINEPIMRVLSIKEGGRGTFVEMPLEKHDVLWSKYGT